MKNLSLFILIGLMLNACSGDVKESLGMVKVTPDEYTVISNPPLSMPPDFRLRAPTDEDVTFKALNNEKAQNILLENNYNNYETKESSKFSAADENLLKRAGSDQIKSDIRRQITDDNKVMIKKEEESTFGKFYYNYLKNKQDPALDPDEEKKRLESLGN